MVCNQKEKAEKLGRAVKFLSNLTPRDIDAVKTVLESIIFKNRIEEIFPGRQAQTWEEEMCEVQQKFRKRAARYSEQEIEDIINEAVAEVRTEEASRKRGRVVDA
jgi:ketol-acid reductoisomerase